MRKDIINDRIKNPRRSFSVKYKWNGILFKFLLEPKGFVDPVICKKYRWIITRLLIKNGRIKWREKNRFKVALLIENPPQIHETNIFPIIGIAERRLVITVAPQKDIWPHGSTYPKNAVIIEMIKIEDPIIHVWVSKKDL